MSKIEKMNLRVVDEEVNVELDFDVSKSRGHYCGMCSTAIEGDEEIIGFQLPHGEGSIILCKKCISTMYHKIKKNYTKGELVDRIAKITKTYFPSYEFSIYECEMTRSLNLVIQKTCSLPLPEETALMHSRDLDKTFPSEYIVVEDIASSEMQEHLEQMDDDVTLLFVSHAVMVTTEGK